MFCDDARFIVIFIDPPPARVTVWTTIVSDLCFVQSGAGSRLESVGMQLGGRARGGASSQATSTKSRMVIRVPLKCILLQHYYVYHTCSARALREQGRNPRSYQGTHFSATTVTAVTAGANEQAPEQDSSIGTPWQRRHIET